MKIPSIKFKKTGKSKKQIDNPQMNPDEPKNEAPDNQNADDGEAMEYEFDEAAEQLQGKLAAEDAEQVPDID